MEGSFRRADFSQARARHPELANSITMLEQAMDNANIKPLDERSAFGGRDNDTVDREYVHQWLIECFQPPSPESLDRIAFVAQRLNSASNIRLPGVILEVSGLHRGYYDAFKVIPLEGGGFTLQSGEYLFVEAKSSSWMDVTLSRSDGPVTPSIYGKQLANLADPLHAFTGGHGYSSDKSQYVACIVADMVSTGETAAILCLKNGSEICITGLTPSNGIRRIARSVRELVDRCADIEAVRALPSARPRHRFYVVGGRIAADSPVGNPVATSGVVSHVEYAQKNGLVETAISYRSAIGEIEQMRSYCSASLDQICRDRGNWLIDIDLGHDGPCLAGIQEILDGIWFGGVEEQVLEALALQQEAAFSELNTELRCKSSPRASLGFAHRRGKRSRRTA